MLHPEVFSIDAHSVQFTSSAPAQRTSQLASLLLAWRQESRFECLRGWRNETYPVISHFGQSPPFLTLERAAVGIFGFEAFGVHLNGYVEGEDGALRLWIARRSPKKSMWPNFLDNMVGGGLPVGLGVTENLVKEAQEEAGLPADLIAQAVPVGAVSYFQELAKGLYPESLFVYDLRLNPEFVPIPEDGEVAEFYLWGVEEVVERMLNEEFSPESALVTLDFLVRRGLVTPENEPNYLAVVAGMHRKLFM